MSDLVWFIITGVVFVLSGLLFIRLGLQIWKKQRMDLIICYHCDKVREENKRAYCTLSGVGVFITGIGFLVSGICTVWIRSALVFVPMSVGLMTGAALLISAIVKYNR